MIAVFAPASADVLRMSGSHSIDLMDAAERGCHAAAAVLRQRIEASDYAAKGFESYQRTLVVRIDAARAVVRGGRA